MKEGGSIIENENSKPYYLSSEEFDALRLDVQSISPEEQIKLQALQKKACGQFIACHGEFINEDQKAYLQADNVLIPDWDKLPLITEAWSDLDPASEETLLNGVQYRGYKILQPTFENNQSGEDQGSLFSPQSCVANRCEGVCSGVSDDYYDFIKVKDGKAIDDKWARPR